MACLRCLRYKRDCDERQPRCNFCRASRLRCRYDRRPVVRRARHEPRREIENNYLPNLTARPEPIIIPERSNERPPVVRPTYKFEPFYNNFRQESLFAKFLASWDDEFPQLHEMDDLEQTALHFNFDEPGIRLPPPYNPIGRKPTEAEIRQGIVSVTWPSELIPSPFQRPRLEGLPVRLLTQYYSRVMDGQLTYKRPDWTYYTFFFHRFNENYRCILSGIQAWASASLYSSDKREGLQDAFQNYDESLAMMLKKWGITVNSPSAAEERRERTATLVASTTAEEKDAMFVAYYFLALVDLMTARTQQLRGILLFIASFLQDLGFKSRMTGVQLRVAYWFCILDGKASAFQRGGGAILKAMGDEESLVSALNSSHTVLQQAFRTTRTEKEQSIVDTKHVLQELMLCLTSLLPQITEAKHRLPDPDHVNAIREKLDVHRQALDAKVLPVDYDEDNQCRATFLIICALYHSLEISFSRSLRPKDPRYAASQHAVSIIQMSQKLENIRPEGLALSSPSMKIWPLPLVMAVIEIEDTVHREWATKLLTTFAPPASGQYSWAKKFVEAVCEREDKADCRLDWEDIMQELNDGLVI